MSQLTCLDFSERALPMLTNLHVSTYIKHIGRARERELLQSIWTHWQQENVFLAGNYREVRLFLACLFEILVCPLLIAGVFSTIFVNNYKYLFTLAFQIQMEWNRFRMKSRNRSYSFVELGGKLFLTNQKIHKFEESK